MKRVLLASSGYASVFSLLLVTALPVLAHEKSHSITIYLGNHFNKSQDLVFSEQIYSGSGLISSGIGYMRQSNSWFLRFNFDYDRIDVSPSTLIFSPVFGDRDASTANQSSIQISYARKMSENKLFKWYLGGLFKAKYYQANIFFGLREDEAYFYENSVNANLTAVYQFNKSNHVRANLYFPLLSLIARPEFAIVDNRDIQGEGGITYLYKRGELAFWGDYQAVNFAVTYSRALSQVVDGFVRYHAEYWRFKKPDTLSVLKNNFDIGLSFRF